MKKKERQERSGSTQTVPTLMVTEVRLEDLGAEEEKATKDTLQTKNCATDTPFQTEPKVSCLPPKQNLNDSIEPQTQRVNVFQSDDLPKPFSKHSNNRVLTPSPSQKRKLYLRRITKKRRNYNENSEDDNELKKNKAFIASERINNELQRIDMRLNIPLQSTPDRRLSSFSKLLTCMNLNNEI